MGRYSTGAWTVYGSTRIEMSYLLKVGYIKKNCIVQGEMSWINNMGQKTAALRIKTNYKPNGGNNYIELDYRITKSNGEKKDFNYKIELFEQPSNLGKGSVLYFICPVTWRKCRVLYMAYGYEKFKSREAYQHRLYYDCQMSSKLGKYNDNYWRIDKQLSKIEKAACRGNRTYKGKPTKGANRYNRLYEKQQWMDEARWTIGVPKCLKKDIKFFQ